MDITGLPYNAHLGILRGEGEVLVAIEHLPHLNNHLGTVHAGALFSLAEAASGEFLLRIRGERTEIGGVVRKANSKFSAPAKGRIEARSTTGDDAVAKALATVTEKGRAPIAIDIVLTGPDNTMVGRFTFDWILGTTS